MSNLLEQINSAARKTSKLVDFAMINPIVRLERGKEYPFLDMSEVKALTRIPELSNKKTFIGSGSKFEMGDTLFARITPCLENGKITRVLSLNTPAFGSTEFIVLRGKDGTSDNNFIYYLAQTYKLRKKAEQSMIGASGRQRVDRVAFENIPVAFPSLTTQKKIAEILSAYDSKIENNNKIIKNLEATSQALFNEWFVNLHFPGNEKVKMVESEMGEIPEEWSVGKIKDLIRVESGFPFSSSVFNDTGKYKLVTIRNVQDGSFVADCDNLIAELPSKLPKHCLLHSGDILLSLTGNVGRICLVNGENYVLNQRVSVLIPIHERDRAYAYFLFRRSDFQNLLISISKGTAQLNLSPVETKELETIIPNTSTLQKYSEIATPMYKKIVEINSENVNLKESRDQLLAKLI